MVQKKDGVGCKNKSFGKASQMQSVQKSVGSFGWDDVWRDDY